MFKQHPFVSKVLFFLFIAIFLQNCTTDEASTIEPSETTETEDLISIALAEDLQDLASDEVTLRNLQGTTFKTLNQALRCTNLTGALFSGRKTIYAPTDAAFAKLGLTESNVCSALDAATLTNILLYHVTDGLVSINERGCIEMLNGDIAQLTSESNRLFINDLNISRSFAQRRIGSTLLVYVINDVLQVPDQTIVQTAIGASQFSSLVAAVLAADPAIAAALSDPNQILTVFAPTNEAFDNLISALGATSLEDLVDQVGVEALSTILLYHVVDACAFSNDLQNGQLLTTLQGEQLRVNLRNLSIIDKTNTPAGLVTSGLDILTSNGIVHTIDKVLLPNAILENL